MLCYTEGKGKDMIWCYYKNNKYSQFPWLKSAAKPVAQGTQYWAHTDDKLNSSYFLEILSMPAAILLN